ncbi:MAG: hypothetical protein ACRD16_09140 [Thermoanaerobaculia bacterium]
MRLKMRSHSQHWVLALAVFSVLVPGATRPARAQGANPPDPKMPPVFAAAHH